MTEGELRFESPGVGVDRRGRRRTLAVLTLVASLATPFIIPWHASLAGILLLFAYVSFFSAVAILLKLRFDPALSAHPRERHPGELLFHDGALTVRWSRGARTYAPGSLVDGWAEALGPDVTVCVRTRDGDLISASVPDVGEARRLLAAAGVSAEQQALRMRLVNATTQVFGGGFLVFVAGVILTLAAMWSCAALFLSEDGGATAGALLVGVMLLFLLLIRALIPAQVVIGTDGLTIQRVVTRRFIPFASIREVALDSGAVVVVTDGKKIRLPTGERYFGARSHAERSMAAALHARIEEARAAGKHGSSAEANAGELERGAQPFAAWRERLRKLTTAEALYRRRAVSPDALTVVLEDASAPAQRRVAAALALSAVADPQVAQRLREVVASSADERLRVALDAAAADALTEDELEAATGAEAKRA